MLMNNIPSFWELRKNRLSNCPNCPTFAEKHSFFFACIGIITTFAV